MNNVSPNFTGEGTDDMQPIRVTVSSNIFGNDAGIFSGMSNDITLVMVFCDVDAQKSKYIASNWSTDWHLYAGLTLRFSRLQKYATILQNKVP